MTQPQFAKANRWVILRALMERECTVINPLGLHARPAAEFVRAAMKFGCKISLLRQGEVFSATSILEVLSANLECGATFRLSAEGPEAEVALDTLSALLASLRDDV